MAHDHDHSHGPLEPPAQAAEGNVVVAMLAGLLIAGGSLVLGAAKAQQPHGGAHDAGHGGQHASAPVARGRKAAIATAAPEASQAGLDVMSRGGNAFDALVSSSFVVSVVRPQSTGIGGGGFVVYHDAARQQEGAIDGREVAPESAHPDMFVDPRTGKLLEGRHSDYFRGPRSAGVPGLVAMLYEVYQTLGSKKVSWSELVQPAIGYARDGFKVTPGLSRQIKKYREVLERYPASAAVFLPEGEVPQPGSILRQPGLAQTLTEIANKGADGFYGGWVAAEIVDSANAEFVETTAVFNEADFANYQVSRPEVVRGTYRGHSVVSFPPPSSGGVHLIQMLNILSGYELGKLGHNSEQHVHYLAEAMRLAYADRMELLADPAFVDVPTKKLIDPAYAAKLRATIDPDRAGKSTQVLGGALLGDDTTHISIVDNQGNAVASTQTINTGLGSCFVAGKTGVLLNNEMNDFTGHPDAPNAFGARQSAKNLPEKGKRPLSSMTPTLVFDAENKVKAVVGTPGGTKIITTVLQLVINLIDFDHTPEHAMAAPRVHHQHLPDVLYLESPLSGVRRGLAARGHEVKLLAKERAICNAQIVVIQPNGERVAVSDPRGTGEPAAE